MNDKRRAALREASNLLAHAHAIIARAAEKEQECLDNMPENLIDSDRYAKMEDAVDYLDETADKVEEAKDLINEAIELIEKASA